MDTEKLYDDFVNLINSITDDELQASTEKAIEDSKESYIMDGNNGKKLIIPFGNYQIVAEISDISPDIPNELWVHIRDKDNRVVQDICLVRPHFDYIRSKGEFETDNDFVDCLVWGDSDSEDYTEKHVIGVYKEDGE